MARRSIDPARPTRPQWREALLGAGPVVVGLWVLLVVGALVAAYRWLDPTPARRIVLATGPAQGAYGEFGKRYAALLQAEGVTLVLRPTEGSGENLALLRDRASGVQAAFIQGGVVAPDGAALDAAVAERPGRGAASRLASLGAVAREPLWLFYRADSAERLLGQPGAAPTNLSQLAGWRVSTGPPGGGSGPLFRRLADANGLPAGTLHSGGSLQVDNVVELVQGRVDALAMVSAADAPLVQYLLRTPGVRLFDFVQSEAYARRFAFLQALVLPRGVADLAAELPPQDVRLVATTASLVVRGDLHPALGQLLVQTAARVHAEAGWFQRDSEFPQATGAGLALPLSPEAERFYRAGTPWLQRHLPFWLASFIDRMWIVVLPLLAALLPLSRVVPPLVQLRLRSRVYRWYANLRAVEEAAETPEASPQRLLADLEGIDAQIEHIGLPLAYTGELYDLRSHVQLVRQRLQARLKAQSASAAINGEPGAS